MYGHYEDSCKIQGRQEGIQPRNDFKYQIYTRITSGQDILEIKRRIIGDLLMKCKSYSKTEDTDKNKDESPQNVHWSTLMYGCRCRKSKLVKLKKNSRGGGNV